MKAKRKTPVPVPLIVGELMLLQFRIEEMIKTMDMLCAEGRTLRVRIGELREKVHYSLEENQ